MRSRDLGEDKREGLKRGMMGAGGEGGGVGKERRTIPGWNSKTTRSRGILLSTLITTPVSSLLYGFIYPIPLFNLLSTVLISPLFSLPLPSLPTFFTTSDPWSFEAHKNSRSNSKLACPETLPPSTPSSPRVCPWALTR